MLDHWNHIVIILVVDRLGQIYDITLTSCKTRPSNLLPSRPLILRQVVLRRNQRLLGTAEKKLGAFDIDCQS